MHPSIVHLPAGARADGLSGLVRKITPAETPLVAEHFLRLDAEARRRRFSHDVSDDYIRTYARTAADIGNLTFGYFEDGAIRAVAELKYPRPVWNRTAEAAFSVEREFANRGLATLMMGRIIRSARNRGIRHLMLYCLSDNAKMQAIAKHYHADLSIDGGSVTADIVPKRFDYASLVSEAIEDRVGIMHSMLEMQSRWIRAA